MKKAIIFDLDGTLIDTPSGIVETMSATLAHMKRDPVDPDIIRATIGMPLNKAFAKLLDVELSKDATLIQTAILTYQALFKEIVLPKAKTLIFPGVREGLLILQSKGYRLAVATSKVYKSAKSLIEAAELWHFFDLVLGADDVSMPKPDPEMGKLALSRLGVLPENAVMVGDTTHDLLMAKSCGMPAIAVTYGVHDVVQLQSASPQWQVDTFSEVLDCVIVKEAVL